MIRIHSSITKKLGKILAVGSYDGSHTDIVENPLAMPYPWWQELFQRIKLFPWWIKYNIGLTEESDLKDKIICLAVEMKLEKKWVKKTIRHAISEFSKKGLGLDYYGYHNIDHELEATYFTLLSINGHRSQSKYRHFDFSYKDIKYLFIAALFHDYDPSKKFDKPNEESVEWFLRNDPKIKRFIEIADIDIDIVIAIIYRTAYPFTGKIAEYATKRINDLIEKQTNGHQENKDKLVHYQQLGWFLSICERIAGYALGDFEHANKLARSNAHALGWHPSIMNEESVKYFDSLKQENEMLQFVLDGIPSELKNNFFNNVSSFKKQYEQEKKIRDLAIKKQIKFTCKVERIENSIGKDNISNYDLHLKKCVLGIYNKLPLPLKWEELHFISSLSDPNTILITLRINKKQLTNQYENDGGVQMANIGKNIDIENNNDYLPEEDEFIVGYVKGGPVERYGFRRGTVDENYGKNNTLYMEWICIKPGYWGSNGGHLLRMHFLLEAKRRGYDFVTGYVHRDVIYKRISKGETIQIVQKYDPDKLDYYRIDLHGISYNSITEDVDSDEFATVVYP